MPTSLQLTPYLEQYFGIWAMAEDRFWAEFEYAKQLNLHVHLASDEPAKAQAAASRGEEFSRSGNIAIIGLHGKLMKQQPSMGSGTSTVIARRQVRAAMKDADVSAIMLHIDSPGGTVAGTAELAADIAAAAKIKPVHAYIEDLGTSAAYWLASQASRIAVNATGQVGSIGTYGVIYDYSGAAAMEGVKAYVVRAGKFKGMGVPGTEVTAEQLAELQRNIDALNEHFLQGVSDGRKMALERVRELADGRVYVGKEAKQIGFVDAVESFEAALSRLQKNSSSRSKTMAMSDHLVPEASVEEPVLATVAAPVKPAAPQPATYAELKAACVGADADFICKQLEVNATVAQAQQAWMAEQQRRIEAANAEAAKAREEARLAKVEKPGVAPVASGKVTEQAATGDPIAEFNEAVAEEMRRTGKPRHAAHAAVCRARPELRDAYVAAWNEQHRAVRT